MYFNTHTPYECSGCTACESIFPCDTITIKPDVMGCQTNSLLLVNTEQGRHLLELAKHDLNLFSSKPYDCQ